MLADEHDVYLIADDVYDEMVLDEDREHVAAARFDEAGRVVSVYSFSKIYAMTGWRLGYCRRIGRAGGRPAQAAGAGGFLPERRLAEGCRGGALGPAGRGRRDARRLPRTPRPGLGAGAGARAARVPDPGHLLHADRRVGGGPAVARVHAAAARGVRGWRWLRARSSAPAAQGLVRVSLAEEPDVIEEGLGRLSDAVRALATSSA